MRRSLGVSIVLVVAEITACKRQYVGVNSLRIVVPVKIVCNAAGEATPVVSIQLGDKDTTLNVLFDTGSGGLRILKGVVTNINYQGTATPDTAFYGTPPNLFRISGMVGKAAFSVGRAVSWGSVCGIALLARASPVLLLSYPATASTLSAFRHTAALRGRYF